MGGTRLTQASAHAVGQIAGGLEAIAPGGGDGIIEILGIAAPAVAAGPQSAIAVILGQALQSAANRGRHPWAGQGAVNT